MAWMSSPSVMASTLITLAHCDAISRGHPRHQQSPCAVVNRLMMAGIWGRHGAKVEAPVFVPAEVMERVLRGHGRPDRRTTTDIHSWRAVGLMAGSFRPFPAGPPH